ncbi:MAG: hypothetical protein IJY70_02510 [Clostridia bacterium]|nr:hypothetical protein [Clostridia bacterium]
MKAINADSKHAIILGIIGALLVFIFIALIIVKQIFLAVISLMGCIVCLYFCYTQDDRIAKIFITAIVIIAITAFIIAITIVASNSTRAGDDDGCSICGDDIFAGQFCEEHFNEWANGY